MTDTNTLAPSDDDLRALWRQHAPVIGGTLSFARAVLAKWGAPALASQPFAYEFSRSNGDGTHSEHIERGRLQEVAPGRWEHSGLPRGALADKPIKALYTTPQTQPAAVPASGPVGFDHKTAANFLNGKIVADEEVRLFVAHSRWAHDDRDWLRNTIADLRREIAQRDSEIALLKTSLLDVEALQPAAQAQLEAVGAGGVGPLVGATQRLDRETSQFLSDVMTAAGLVEHGKQCKALAERVANGCRTLRTALAAAAPAPPIMCKPPKSWNKRGQDACRRGWEAREAALAAAVPAQPVAHVSQETFNDDGTSDIIIPALPIGMALYAAPQPAAQALDSVRVFWQQHTQADALSMTMAELHADAERAIRAALAAPAQPVTWPRNAAEVREFMDAHCQREERANDDSSPSDDDLYALTAYNFLSAVNSWADSPHHPGATQPAAQAQLDAGGAGGVGPLLGAPAQPVQPVPAPGVEAVSEREFKQFLSDVLTAAGLVTHGKKCKDLGRRLGEMSMRLLTAPKTAAVPAQAGEYPVLPPLQIRYDGLGRTTTMGYEASQMHAYADATCAARGAAQAVPVDAAKLPSPANVGTAPKCLNLNDQAMWVLGWNECLDAACAAQKGNHD